MNKFDRRDQRRAMSVIKAMNDCPDLTVVIVRDLIAAALKREREETAISAVKALWAQEADKAAKRAEKRATNKGGR